MKKFFAILMVICLMASALSITAFADFVPGPVTPPADGIVLRVSALMKDETTVELLSFETFESGWDYAVALGSDPDILKTENFDRIVVDILTDWNANDEGEFGDDDRSGFQNDTIYVPDNTRLTLNLNGHTINRRLTDYERDGEVIYIDENADVIITGGTITGGFSSNGAGGIHVYGANVVLNDVKVMGNVVEDDSGAGIALYHNAKLTMKGGKISDNRIRLFWGSDSCRGAGLYVEKSSATLEGVTFLNNQFESGTKRGAAISALRSTVSIDNCTFTKNGFASEGLDLRGASSICDFSIGCTVEVKNSTFSDNGLDASGKQLPDVIMVDQAHMTMDSCTITGNRADYLIVSQGELEVSNTNLTDNTACTFSNVSTKTATFTNCVFKNNKVWKDSYSFDFYYSSSKLTFIDCDTEDSTFEDINLATFISTDKSALAGSLFGEGSLTLVISVIALAVAVAAVMVNVAAKKANKPATAKKDEDEE